MMSPLSLKFKKRIPTLLLAGGMLCAIDTSAIAEGNPAIAAVNRSASLAYIRTSMYYVEPDEGQFLNTGYFSEEKGGLNGGRIAFSYMGSNGFYLKAAFTRSTGMLDLHTFVGTTPTSAQSLAMTKELDLKVGKGFASGAEWMFTPYLSGGRRYWKRELLPGTPNGFDETFDFHYLGVGNMIQYSPWASWVFTADGMIAKTVKPTINVPVAGLDHAVLGSAPLVTLRLEADYQAAARLHLFAGLEYTDFSFGQTAVQSSGFLETGSRTQLRSFEAGLRYSF